MISGSYLSTTDSIQQIKNQNTHVDVSNTIPIKLSSTDISNIFIQNINNIYIKYFQDTYFTPQTFLSKVWCFTNLDLSYLLYLTELQTLVTNVPPNKSLKEFFLLDLTTNNIQLILNVLELIELKGAIEFFKDKNIDKQLLSSKAQLTSLMKEQDNGNKTNNKDNERFFSIFKMKITLLLLGNYNKLLEYNDIQLNPDEKEFLSIFSDKLNIFEKAIKDDGYIEDKKEIKGEIDYQKRFNHIFTSQKIFFSKELFESVNDTLSEEMFSYVSNKQFPEHRSDIYYKSEKNKSTDNLKKNFKLLLKDASNAFFDGFQHQQFFSILKTTTDEIDRVQTYTESIFKKILSFCKDKNTIINHIKQIIKRHNNTLSNKDQGMGNLNFDGINNELNLLLNTIFLLNDEALTNILASKNYKDILKKIINEILPKLKERKRSMKFESTYNAFIMEDFAKKNTLWMEDFQFVKKIIENEIFIIPLTVKQTLLDEKKRLNKVLDNVKIQSDEAFKNNHEEEESSEHIGLFHSLWLGFIASLKSIYNLAQQSFAKENTNLQPGAEKYQVIFEQKSRPTIKSS